MTAIPYTKLVGTGNDFVLVDATRKDQSRSSTRWRQLAKQLCHAKDGLDVDGLLVLEPSAAADVGMRIFNPDGSEAAMCGNGIRCLAWYASQQRNGKAQLKIETKDGVKSAQIRPQSRVRVDMGVPRFLEHLDELRVGTRTLRHIDLVHSGVPHAVWWVKDVHRADVDGIGRKLREHRRFRPQGANVDFTQVVSAYRQIYRARKQVVHDVTLRVRTYERGVEGETQACGTGSVAAAVAFAHTVPFNAVLGRESDLERFEVTVQLRGGALRVEFGAKYQFDRQRLVFTNVFMEGDVRRLSQGRFAVNGRTVR